MKCAFCNSVELQIHTLIQCDSCSRLVHKESSCSNLSGLEIRLVELNEKRGLKFFCKDCTSGLFQVAKLTTVVAELQAKLRVLESKTYHVNCCNTVGSRDHEFDMTTSHDAESDEVYMQDSSQGVLDNSQDYYQIVAEETTVEEVEMQPNLYPNMKRPRPSNCKQTCKICNKTLASPASYYVHMKQHSDNKPFCCTRCGASFCRKPYLEVHMRSHTGEKPYQCDICKKRFTQKSSLNTHKRVHSGLRPYACPTCFKTFTVKGYLTSHQLTHVSDSGVRCAKCQTRFTSKHLYFEHMRNHHRKRYECGECSKAFAKESFLIRHINRLHQKNGGAGGGNYSMEMVVHE